MKIFLIGFSLYDAPGYFGCSGYLALKFCLKYATLFSQPASARGTGIKVVSRWTQIPKKRAVVVQRYVSKPYLINGSKFDLRLYVLITSVHPLRIYLYKDGLARFASGSMQHILVCLLFLFQK